MGWFPSCPCILDVSWLWQWQHKIRSSTSRTILSMVWILVRYPKLNSPWNGWHSFFRNEFSHCFTFPSVVSSCFVPERSSKSQTLDVWYIMYGTFTYSYIYHKHQLKVGKCTIHWSFYFWRIWNFSLFRNGSGRHRFRRIIKALRNFIAKGSALSAPEDPSASGWCGKSLTGKILYQTAQPDNSIYH